MKLQKKLMRVANGRSIRHRRTLMLARSFVDSVQEWPMSIRHWRIFGRPADAERSKQALEHARRVLRAWISNN